MRQMLHWLVAATGFVSYAIGQELLAAKHEFPGLPTVAPLGSKSLSGAETSNHAAKPGPTNITGQYRGTWRRQDAAGVDPVKLQNLNRKDGLVIYQLRTSESKDSGVHNVEGEVVVRDGVYVTEFDLELKLKGIYVVETGRLYAVLTGIPPTNLMVSLEASDYDNHTASYRDPRCTKPHMLEVRQALREVGFGEANDEVYSPLRFIQLQHRDGKRRKSSMWRKTCELHMDFAISSVAGIPASSTTGEETGQRRNVLDAPAFEDMAASNLVGEEQAVGQADSIMNGTISSPNCHLQLQVNATTDHRETSFSKAINYTLMITGISFAQVILLIRQMEATSNQATAAKVSLATLGTQAIMDAYLCLLHLTIGIMVEPLFNAYATAAFFEFVIFAIFEMRYLLAIWRARRQNSGEEWGAQRQLTILYARFYGALLGGIFLTYQLKRYMKYIVFGLYSFWIPQIVLCVRDDVRQPLKPMYVIGMSLTRLALPVYLFGCPHNLPRVPFSPAICIGLTLHLAFQVVVLLMQTVWGPRCFIPKRFLPAKYDYYRPITPRQLAGEAEDAGDVETGDGSTECVICMNPVEVERSNSRMVTPCDHFFHPACLNRWMDVKMECPTCRRALPAPDPCSLDMLLKCYRQLPFRSVLSYMSQGLEERSRKLVQYVVN